MNFATHKLQITRLFGPNILRNETLDEQSLNKGNVYMLSLAQYLSQSNAEATWANIFIGSYTDRNTSLDRRWSILILKQNTDFHFFELS